jgi:mannose/fructose-specific phosphotransferase system component IIA
MSNQDSIQVVYALQEAVRRVQRYANYKQATREASRALKHAKQGDGDFRIKLKDLFGADINQIAEAFAVLEKVADVMNNKLVLKELGLEEDK